MAGRRKVNPEEFREFVGAVNADGMYLLRRGMKDNALEQLKTAEAVIVANPEASARDCSVMALTCNNLACCYKQRGLPRVALQLLQRAQDAETTPPGEKRWALNAPSPVPGTAAASGAKAVSSTLALAAAGGAFDNSAASVAVTKLNTCAALSTVGRHDEAEQLAAEAVELLAAEVDRLAAHRSATHRHPTSGSDGDGDRGSRKAEGTSGGAEAPERDDGADAAAEDAGEAGDDSAEKKSSSRAHKEKQKSAAMRSGPEEGQEEGALLAVACHNLGAEREHLGRFAEAGVAYRHGFEAACKALGARSLFARTLQASSSRALGKASRHPEYRSHQSFGRLAATSWPVRVTGTPRRARTPGAANAAPGCSPRRFQESAARTLKSPLVGRGGKDVGHRRVQAGRLNAASVTPPMTSRSDF
eukprot:TRINITY_DN92082_c0_g1_i1.p1 TRINITY_DN92082_c0_g1~~TRINITY_DN92082_c0_g1_i1.p1  ORF type:complete len:417 (-),score=106.40 TRINITY_DN92082_c0_g1_i1:54-1304(-)